MTPTRCLFLSDKFEMYLLVLKTNANGKINLEHGREPGREREHGHEREHGREQDTELSY